MVGRRGIIADQIPSFLTRLAYGRSKWIVFSVRVFLSQNLCEAEMSQVVDQLHVLRNVVVDVQYVTLYIRFYVFCSISVFKSIQSFFKRRFRGADIRYHNGATISPKGILQQPCEFRVAVRNEISFVSFFAQSVDAVSESE